VTAARHFALLLPLLAAAPICMAQASYSASLSSDYRYRGISLSDNAPSAQLGANFDSAQGAYGGLSLARVRFRYTEASALAVAYAGWARRFGDALSWDAGISAYRYRGAEKYDYRELYAGLNGERSGVRLSLAPHYFGIGGRTAYLEVNSSRALTGRLDLVGHAGYLHEVGTSAGRFRMAPRFDARIGVAAAFDGATVQLAWSTTRKSASLYYGGGGASPSRLVLSTALAF
jgi:uncharacterized protein (TIGR02001 family)